MNSSKDAKATLAKIKLAIVTCPSASSSSSSVEREAAREALELGCLVSVRSEDPKGFERNFAQLSPYYTAPSSAEGSDNRATVLGLHLMHLLAENKLSEFHSELELIPVAIRKHCNTAFPILLEQYMMEGSFSKFFAAGQQLPTADYNIFMARLFDSAREEIISCCEAAYSQLEVADIQRMMGLREAGAREEVLDFIEDREQCRLSDDGKTVHFDTHVQTQQSKADLKSWELTRQSLMYATELERIV